jgi:hypothetical protein
LGSLRFNRACRTIFNRHRDDPGRRVPVRVTAQPRRTSSASFSVRAAGPSKRPNPHDCKTSWRFSIPPGDLRGRSDNRELCPFQRH